MKRALRAAASGSLPASSAVKYTLFSAWDSGDGGADVMLADAVMPALNATIDTTRATPEITKHPRPCADKTWQTCGLRTIGDVV